MDMKQKILIVEDEPEIAELIRMHMDRNGFRRPWCTLGKRASMKLPGACRTACCLI